MARFYEQYGYTIIWSLTSILGIGLIYWLLVALAMQGEVLPSWASLYILATHGVVSSVVEKLVSFVETRIQWFGALATLATFVFGLVTGIRQARRQLPRRLVQFMAEQLAPVYDNSEAMVSAVTYRSAKVPHSARLFRKDPLNRALNALGGPFRPRWRRSLDEAIKEAGTHIDVTEKRLKSLHDIRAHARILRGAVRNAERSAGSQPDAGNEREVEADFTAAIENATARMAALELRGLLRARLGNFAGALQDFRSLETHAEDAFCTRGHARALRHQADIRKIQAAGTNSRPLRDARRNLNDADRLFADGRTLGPDDWLERGHNRESYGEVQASIATIAGASMQNALKSFSDSLAHFQRLGPAAEHHCQRVRDRIARL